MFERILVPLDGSTVAEQALPLAVTLADALALPMHLVRVVAFDSVRASVLAGPAVAEAWARHQAAEAREAAAYLDEQTRALRTHACPLTSEVRLGDPADELLATIQAGDLVVMTTHGRGGIERWVLGSVADAVVRRAAAPVLLVRVDGGARPLSTLCTAAMRSPS